MFASQETICPEGRNLVVELTSANLEVFCINGDAKWSVRTRSWWGLRRERVRSGGEFEDTSDQSELDELDDIMVALLCPHCDHILYRPIVLNCGHGAYFTYS